MQKKIKEYNKIVFCGVGGSAMPGEIIEALGINVPIHLAREKLPKWADKNTLCFVISYSGNTKETLSLYNQAKKNKCRILIITSNGKLAKKPDEKIIVKKGILPREALFLMLKPIFKILKIKFKAITGKNKKTASKLAKKIAKKLKNKDPAIHASSEALKAVAYRWQTQLSENSKVLADSNYFPEIAHNDIEALRDSKDIVILLMDKETKQIKAAKKILKPIEIKLKGKTKIEKIIYGIYLGDLVSKELANIRKINYKKTPRITRLHKLMEK